MVEGVVLILIVIYTLSEANGYPVGIKCNSNWECPSPYSYCAIDLHLCICQPSHPVRLPNGICLPALPLGAKCEFSDSCRFVDTNSVCHVNKGCICKDGYRPWKENNYRQIQCVSKDFKFNDFWPFEDDSDEDDDDDDDDDDDRNSAGSDVATPIIVGIVLGSVIVCGWSCAICRMYLRKVENQRTRKHIRRVRRHKQNFPRSRDTEVLAPNQRQYTLIPATSTNEPTTRIENHRHSYIPNIESTRSNAANDNRQSLPADFHMISTQLCPDEEPLPGYEGFNKDEPDPELPPTYEEVMAESMNSEDKENAT